MAVTRFILTTKSLKGNESNWSDPQAHAFKQFLTISLCFSLRLLASPIRGHPYRRLISKIDPGATGKETKNNNDVRAKKQKNKKNNNKSEDERRGEKTLTRKVGNDLVPLSFRYWRFFPLFFARCFVNARKYDKYSSTLSL